MCAKGKKYWTAEKQRTAQQLPFFREILESSWKSADVDHPLILGPARSGTRATGTEILMAAWGPRFTSGLETIYVRRWRRCERGGAVGNLCAHQLRLLRRCTPETIRRVTAVTSRCARGDCVTSIAHTTGLYDDTTSSGLEERLEGWDTCQNKASPFHLFRAKHNGGFQSGICTLVGPVPSAHDRNNRWWMNEWMNDELN